MSRIYRCLARRIGHRGSFLLFLALLDFLYGYSLFVTPLQHVDLTLPFHVWGIIWICVGAFLLLGAFAKRDRVHYGVAATIKAAWAGVWVKLWMIHQIPHAWANVALWVSFSGLVVVVSSWPEVRAVWRKDNGKRCE